MKVLLLSQYFPPEVGATQTRAHFFARALAARGHQVTVVAELPNHPKGEFFDGWRGRPWRRSREDGFDAIRVWVAASPRKTVLRRVAFYGTYAANAVLAAALLARGRFDVVFATSPPLPVAAAGWLVSRLKRCPFVMDVRDIWPAAAVGLGELRPGRLMRAAERLERFLYERAAAVTCVTRSFLRHVSERGAAGKAAFLPNGSIPEIFHPGDDGPAKRHELGLRDDEFCVGFFGNHGIAQGLPAVLDAAERLRGEPIRFVFVGEGPVKAQLVSRGLDNVTFLAQVPLTEIGPYVRAMDVLLVPLRRDPIFEQFVPSKLFDFLACAKPVVLSVDGEAAEILAESGGGVHVAPEDDEALARTLRDLAVRRGDLAEMGRRGHQYVKAHFWRDQQVGVLEKLLAGAAQAR